MNLKSLPGLNVIRDGDVYWLRFRSKDDSFGQIRVNDLGSTRHAIYKWINETLGLCACGTELVSSVCPRCVPGAVAKTKLYESRYGAGDVIKNLDGTEAGCVESVVFHRNGSIMYVLTNKSFLDDSETR